MKKNEIYRLVERLSELFRVDSRQIGLDFGLQPVQIEVLHYLSICNKYSDTPMAVTEYLGQTKGTVSQTLKLLETKGYIKKNADKTDKRVTHLQLTNKGKETLGSCIPTPMLENAIKKLDNKATDKMRESLKQLLSAIITTNKIKSFGACISCMYNCKIKENDYYCKLIKTPLAIEETKLICKEHQLKIVDNSNKS